MIAAAAVAAVVLLSGVIGYVSTRWLAGRIPRSAPRGAPRRTVSVAVGIGTSLLVWLAVMAFGLTWTGAAYAFFAIAGMQLAEIDRRSRLLPNALVGIAFAGALVLLTVTAAIEYQWGRVLSAAIGAAALFVLYLLLALFSRGGLGMGDVKFASVIGLYLGFNGLGLVLYGALGGFVIGAVIGLVLLAVRRADLQSAVPFGPSMFAGAIVVLVLAHSV